MITKEALKEALKIKEALFTISDYLDMKPQEVASDNIFLDKERLKKMKEASDIWNKFENEKDIVKRGKMLGIEMNYKLTK